MSGAERLELPLYVRELMLGAIAGGALEEVSGLWRMPRRPPISATQVGIARFTGDGDGVARALARCEDALKGTELLPSQLPYVVRARAWAADAQGDRPGAQRLFLDAAASLSDVPITAARLQYEGLRCGARPREVANALSDLRDRCDARLVAAYADHAAALADRSGPALLEAADEFERSARSGTAPRRRPRPRRRSCRVAPLPRDAEARDQRPPRAVSDGPPELVAADPGRVGAGALIDSVLVPTEARAPPVDRFDAGSPVTTRLARFASASRASSRLTTTQQRDRRRGARRRDDRGPGSPRALCATTAGPAGAGPAVRYGVRVSRAGSRCGWGSGSSTAGASAGRI